MRPHPRQAGDPARGGADENPCRGRGARRRGHPDHGAHRCARAPHGFDEALARCKDLRGRRRRHHFPRGAGDRGRDAALLPAGDQALHGQHGAGARRRSCRSAKLQELGYKLAPLSGDAAGSAIAAMQGTLCGAAPGSKSPQPPAISFTDLQGVVRFPDCWSRGDEVSGEGVAAVRTSNLALTIVEADRVSANLKTGGFRGDPPMSCLFASAFVGTADMAGPAAGLVPVGK